MPGRSLNVLRSGKGISALMIDASSSTGGHQEHDLDEVLSDWSLQVVAASTDVHVTLDLSAQSSSGPTYAASLTWASTDGQVSGDLVTLVDTPAKQIRATLEGGASSGGCSAWVCGR